MLLLDTTAIIIIIHPLPLCPTKGLGWGRWGRLMAGAYPRGHWAKPGYTPYMSPVHHTCTDKQPETHLHSHLCAI